MGYINTAQDKTRLTDSLDSQHSLVDSSLLLAFRLLGMIGINLGLEHSFECPNKHIEIADSTIISNRSNLVSDNIPRNP